MAIKKAPSTPAGFQKRAVDMGDLKQELRRELNRRPLASGPPPIAIDFGDLKSELRRGK